MTDPLLRVSQLGKEFKTSEGAVQAVKDVNFEVKAGEFVGLYGPSGCGKSTLLLMCGALLSPDEGSVEIAGQNPYSLAADRRASFRARYLGFVFQQFHLIPYLEVLDNVLVGELASEGNSPSLRSRAEDLLNQFQLGHRLRHKPSALSVGEQQRVALARALLRGPQLLLADEPTGNLDPENAGIILKALQEFAGDGSGAVVMVTHDESARAAADRSLSLAEGSLLSETR